MESSKTGSGRSVLLARGKLLRATREYFYQQEVLEVTTPTLGSRGVTDSQLQNLKLRHENQSYYLQTSPEYAMKRLLASGSGSIYQICPAYRGGERGRYHSVEFMMLEWYRVGYSLADLMTDVEQMLCFVADCLGVKEYDFRQLPRVAYKDLFLEHFDIDPHDASTRELRKLTEMAIIDCGHIVDHDDDGTLSDYLDLLFSFVIEPTLLKPTIVYDYPACQVALAQLGEGNGNTVAKRFEVFVNAMELANGYLELGDADELKIRMNRNNKLRAVRGLEIVEPDGQLLDALGDMPECSGIALGVDRLLMVLLGKNSLSEVMTFTSDRI
ncbi:MAG: EF-P lysine aminoacylase EpmA [Gammaproteobacteria bacterium]|nr:EF-P lysine aminoacylase EpmA [Gammaproteobacteria bacterium]